MPSLSQPAAIEPEVVHLRDALDRWLRDPNVASLEVDVPSRTLRALPAPSVATGDAIGTIARPGLAPQAFEAAFDAAITRALAEARPAGVQIRSMRGGRWVTAFLAVQSLDDLQTPAADVGAK